MPSSYNRPETGSRKPLAQNQRSPSASSTVLGQRMAVPLPPKPPVHQAYTPTLQDRISTATTLRDRIELGPDSTPPPASDNSFGSRKRKGAPTQTSSVVSNPLTRRIEGLPAAPLPPPERYHPSSYVPAYQQQSSRSQAGAQGESGRQHDFYRPAPVERGEEAHGSRAAQARGGMHQDRYNQLYQERAPRDDRDERYRPSGDRGANPVSRRDEGTELPVHAGGGTGGRATHDRTFQTDVHPFNGLPDVEESTTPPRNGRNRAVGCGQQLSLSHEDEYKDSQPPRTPSPRHQSQYSSESSLSPSDLIHANDEAPLLQRVAGFQDQDSPSNVATIEAAVDLGDANERSPAPMSRRSESIDDSTEEREVKRRRVIPGPEGLSAEMTALESGEISETGLGPDDSSPATPLLDSTGLSDPGLVHSPAALAQPERQEALSYDLAGGDVEQVRQSGHSREETTSRSQTGGDEEVDMDFGTPSIPSAVHELAPAQRQEASLEDSQGGSESGEAGQRDPGYDSDMEGGEVEGGRGSVDECEGHEGGVKEEPDGGREDSNEDGQGPATPEEQDDDPHPPSRSILGTPVPETSVSAGSMRGHPTLRTSWTPFSPVALKTGQQLAGEGHPRLPEDSSRQPSPRTLDDTVLASKDGETLFCFDPPLATQSRTPSVAQSEDGSGAVIQLPSDDGLPTTSPSELKDLSSADAQNLTSDGVVRMEAESVPPSDDVPDHLNRFLNMLNVSTSTCDFKEVMTGFVREVVRAERRDIKLDQEKVRREYLDDLCEVRMDFQRQLQSQKEESDTRIAKLEDEVKALNSNVGHRRLQVDQVERKCEDAEKKLLDLDDLRTRCEEFEKKNEALTERLASVERGIERANEAVNAEIAHVKKVDEALTERLASAEKNIAQANEAGKAEIAEVKKVDEALIERLASVERGIERTDEDVKVATADVKKMALFFQNLAALPLAPLSSLHPSPSPSPALFENLQELGDTPSGSSSTPSSPPDRSLTAVALDEITKAKRMLVQLTVKSQQLGKVVQESKQAAQECRQARDETKGALAEAAGEKTKFSRQMEENRSLLVEVGKVVDDLQKRVVEFEGDVRSKADSSLESVRDCVGRLETFSTGLEDLRTAHQKGWEDFEAGQKRLPGNLVKSIAIKVDNEMKSVQTKLEAQHAELRRETTDALVKSIAIKVDTAVKSVQTQFEAENDQLRRELTDAFKDYHPVLIKAAQSALTASSSSSSASTNDLEDGLKAAKLPKSLTQSIEARVRNGVNEIDGKIRADIEGLRKSLTQSIEARVRNGANAIEDKIDGNIEGLRLHFETRLIKLEAQSSFQSMFAPQPAPRATSASAKPTSVVGSDTASHQQCMKAVEDTKAKLDALCAQTTKGWSDFDAGARKLPPNFEQAVDSRVQDEMKAQFEEKAAQLGMTLDKRISDCIPFLVNNVRAGLQLGPDPMSSREDAEHTSDRVSRIEHAFSKVLGPEEDLAEFLRAKILDFLSLTTWDKRKIYSVVEECVKKHEKRYHGGEGRNMGERERDGVQVVGEENSPEKLRRPGCPTTNSQVRSMDEDNAEGRPKNAPSGSFGEPAIPERQAMMSPSAPLLDSFGSPAVDCASARETQLVLGANAGQALTGLGISRTNQVGMPLPPTLHGSVRTIASQDPRNYAKRLDSLEAAVGRQVELVGKDGFVVESRVKELERGLAELRDEELKDLREKIGQVKDGHNLLSSTHVTLHRLVDALGEKIDKIPNPIPVDSDVGAMSSSPQILEKAKTPLDNEVQQLGHALQDLDSRTDKIEISISALTEYSATIENLYKDDLKPRLSDPGILSSLIGGALEALARERVEVLTKELEVKEREKWGEVRFEEGRWKEGFEKRLGAAEGLVKLCVSRLQQG